MISAVDRFENRGEWFVAVRGEEEFRVCPSMTIVGSAWNDREQLGGLVICVGGKEIFLPASCVHSTPPISITKLEQHFALNIIPLEDAGALYMYLREVELPAVRYALPGKLWLDPDSEWRPSCALKRRIARSITRV